MHRESKASTGRAASLITVLALARVAGASPEVTLDDPAYEALLALRARGALDTYSGGFWPLTRARVAHLLERAGETVPDRLTQATGVWISSVRRARGRALWVGDRARPYSTTAHARDLSGSLAVSCEHRGTLPCGGGHGLVGELDAEAGYGEWLAASLRLRSVLGSESYAPDLEIDRGYLSVERGPVVIGVGRDELALGPSARTRLTWGDHAAALDQLRLRTSRPLALLESLQVSAQYTLGRLRAPQRFPGNLVSIVRGQVDVARTTGVGIVQMLQLGGEGAPSLGPVDFVLEHVRRRDATASNTDTSNRRFGFDLETTIRELAGARLYYVLVFEDIRRARLIDAVRYDADHLVGIELAAIGPGRRHDITIEWHQTGVRSHEHTPRTTGFTNAGFIVGAPLGPDAESLYAGARLRFDSFTLYPWFELARLSSDRYEFIVDGPINRTVVGEDEGRYRAGIRSRLYLRENLWLEGEAIFEHVDDFAFASGRSRNNGGVTAAIVWYPDGPLGRLNLN